MSGYDSDWRYWIRDEAKEIEIKKKIWLIESTYFTSTLIHNSDSLVLILTDGKLKKEIELYKLPKKDINLLYRRFEKRSKK